MSSAVHAVDLARGGELVLRRFVRREWLAEEPDVPYREPAALELLRDRPLPTPRLVGSDPAGAEAGDPAVLMTRLPGTIEWAPADLDGFLRGLAALLPAIHATPVGPGLQDYAPYALETSRPPAWTARPAVWERGFALFDEPPPSDERRFIHRDFHPGNVLWSRGAVTGVVDWASASIGSPCADVGHCRFNLAGVLGPRRRRPLPRVVRRRRLPPVLGHRRGARRVRQRDARELDGARGGVPRACGRAAVTPFPANDAAR